MDEHGQASLGPVVLRVPGQGKVKTMRQDGEGNRGVPSAPSSAPLPTVDGTPGRHSGFGEEEGIGLLGKTIEEKSVGGCRVGAVAAMPL